ncbi:MAG: signal recognition particle-docking protein FtsY, partial [Verrucomicrobiae bacterium]|nr:signal recognition particle-docking protein FtsY [Verrucomicrobiae bacterium]
MSTSEATPDVASAAPKASPDQVPFDTALIARLVGEYFSGTPAPTPPAGVAPPPLGFPPTPAASPAGG